MVNLDAVLVNADWPKRALRGAEFVEEEHPRDEGGKFTSDGDAELIKAYTRSGGTYREVNEALRDGEGVGHPTVAALDRAIADHGEPAPAVLYRGMAGWEPEELGLEEGREFSDLGFVSTATTKASANRFATHGEGKLSGQAIGIVFKINTGGIRGLDMNRFSHYGESEFLLPRGATFKVTNVKEGYPGETLAYVTMRVVKK